MVTSIEVFAEITCPFAYVGLSHVVDHVGELDTPIDVVVRAWPLEWVNGSGLAVDGVQEKAAVLCEQLGVELFDGVNADTWPATTVPAHALTAAAYATDAATGLAVATALRSEVFERGSDIGDHELLADIAARHRVTFDPGDDATVRAEYEGGRARGVTGSPHFFVGDSGFFCPALDLHRDADDHLIARFDPEGLAAFLASVELAPPSPG